MDERGEERNNRTLSAFTSIVRTSAVRRRVLIVDDNIDGARMLAALIRTLGHESEYCINGYAALDAAIKYSPSLAFIDLALPDMDGWALAQALRRKPGFRQIRIIAMTGHYGENERQRSLDAGFDAHLVKPIDPAVIVRLLDEDTQRSAQVA
jgi:CheY-like chemotaxis protein